MIRDEWLFTADPWPDCKLDNRRTSFIFDGTVGTQVIKVPSHQCSFELIAGHPCRSQGMPSVFSFISLNKCFVFFFYRTWKDESESLKGVWTKCTFIRLVLICRDGFWKSEHVSVNLLSWKVRGSAEHESVKLVVFLNVLWLWVELSSTYQCGWYEAMNPHAPDINELFTKLQ